MDGSTTSISVDPRQQLDDVVDFVNDSWLASTDFDGPTFLWNHMISAASAQADDPRNTVPVAAPNEVADVIGLTMQWYFDSISSTVPPADRPADGVSAATITSNAGKTAGADCLFKASGTTVTVSVDVEANEEPDVITITSQEDADAVVVGCGAAGIMAALELQAAGVKTILLEKGSSCGVSNGSVAGGPALAETRVQAAENATVSVETLFNCEYGFS